MQQHSQGTRFVVFDDVLNGKQINDAHQRFQNSQLVPTISPINQLHDGFAFKGPGPLSYMTAQDLNTPQRDLIAHLAAVCIRALYPSAQDTGQRWRYSCTYMAYTAGTQLSWHQDSDGHDAVFNYYLDPWQGHWGGELDLIDCPSPDTPDDASTDMAIVDSPLNITSVIPRANRMTVMYAQTLHRVRRVDPLAGSAIRRAISGSVALCPAETDQLTTLRN